MPAAARPQLIANRSQLITAPWLLGLSTRAGCAAGLQVRRCVTAVMGGAEVADSTPLMTAGIDSLGAGELRKDLNRWVLADTLLLAVRQARVPPCIRAPPTLPWRRLPFTMPQRARHPAARHGHL